MPLSAPSAFAVFDLDGTLLDTLEDIADALNYVLKGYGFPVHPIDAYKYFVGNGVDNLILSALPKSARDENTISSVKRDYSQRYANHSQDKTKPYPGISDTLDRLKSEGISLAVLSNKPHTATCYLIDTFFPGFIDVTLGQRDGIPHKPDPFSVYEIIQALKAENSRGFYIGDTSTDMLTGQNAGLFTIGVLWGFRTKAELQDSGANAIIAKPSDLLDIILDKNNSFGYIG